MASNFRQYTWNESYFFRLLLARLGIVYLWLAMCRAVFYAYNISSFPSLSVGELGGIFFYALHFDTSSILYVNLLLVALLLIPIDIRLNKWYAATTKIIFVLTNFACIFLEFADALYFPHSFRRIVRSDFDMQQDIWNLLPYLILEFWWAIAAMLLMMGLGNYLYHKTSRWAIPTVANKGHYLSQFFLFLIGIGLTIIGMRGGLQDRPIMSSTAIRYVSDTRLVPLVTNATLNLIHSFQQKTIQIPSYFSESELAQYNTIHHFQPDTTPFQKRNVLIIIMESMGKEYTGYFNKSMPSRTPFLDSLFESGRGMLFTNAYANGTRSTQGVVAVTSGLPALMEDPFMFSAFQNNRIHGIASYLLSEGYKTAFFHNGNIGTMDFDKFTPLVGFKNYYGRQHYDKVHPNNQDYDGHWGIYDRPFLQYALDTLNSYPTPFCATIFNISPHHPYAVPANFEPQETNELNRAIRYSDIALREFWAKAQQQSWFQNTVFVFVADHIGASQQPQFSQRATRYQVPLFMYCPADTSLRGNQATLAQQIDILPTLLRYLHYPQPFACFGTDLLDTIPQPRYHYSFDSGIFQIVDSSYVLHFDGEHFLGFYNFLQDTFLQTNLLGKMPQQEKSLENQLKAMIQAHHTALVKNQLP